MNEGHASFMALERIRIRIPKRHVLREAREATICGNVFTTHTPVRPGMTFHADNRAYFTVYHPQWA